MVAGKNILQLALCGSGWLLLLILGTLIYPRVYRHFIVRLPSVQQGEWQKTIALKKENLSQLWLDQRPLILVIGDSHVELGDWYDCFRGAYAMRNCGLSRAKIEEVESLATAIADRNPEAVVLICGFNNLASGDSIDSCMDRYQSLISTVQSKIHPHSIIALPVTPLRASFLDSKAASINKKIALFNLQLAGLCSRDQVNFADVTPALVDERGSLYPEMTIDGLHLNQQGYAQLATVLNRYLPKTPASDAKH